MAILMLEGGADIRHIQEILGHVETSTTAIYTRVSIRHLKQAGIKICSGGILGMGETQEEVIGAMADLRHAGVDIVTFGQYLRPSAAHLPVDRWWTPDEFDALRITGEAMGFAHVEAGPLTRSSYHARQAAAAATEVAAAT